MNWNLSGSFLVQDEVEISGRGRSGNSENILNLTVEYVINNIFDG